MTIQTKYNIGDVVKIKDEDGLNIIDRIVVTKNSFYYVTHSVTSSDYEYERNDDLPTKTRISSSHT